MLASLTKQKSLTRIIYLIKVSYPAYAPLRETKAVTIALGLVCADGAVIGADRQITKEGGLKYQKKKICIFGVHGNIPLQCGFTYCGDPDTAAFFEREIGKVLVGGFCSGNVFTF